MSDITKCADHYCPARDRCWRFCAPASMTQAYEDFKRRDGASQCDSIMPVTAKEKRSWRTSMQA